MSSDNNETVQNKVTPEFKNKILKWVSLDDSIRELRAKTKEITAEKKELEQFILDFLHDVDEKSVAISDGKLSRNVSKTKAPLKKETIAKSLNEITKDMNKAQLMTDHILNSRPMVERINLKRTRNRKPKD